MRTTWTQQLDEQFKELYPDTDNIKIAEVMGISLSSISNRAHKLQCRKSEAYKALHSTHYKKGHRPYNKGKPMPPALYEKCKGTMFKKGHLPHNTKSDGDISIRIDTRGIPYLHKRVSLGKWIPLHRLLWEEHHGQIPQGHCVVFVDGNQANVDISNLKLVTRQEHVRNNSNIRYPAELRLAIRRINKLNKLIENEHIS